jgi:hypothetical protein
LKNNVGFWALDCKRNYFLLEHFGNLFPSVDVKYLQFFQGSGALSAWRESTVLVKYEIHMTGVYLKIYQPH